ncbi:MAG TPA: ATPase, T2SS/T4P/T4SS family, partial [Anaerolineales bacterium]|nr:ATPase, T2SS/T4P/T4SS family [Anaerolineales bacterium]
MSPPLFDLEDSLHRSLANELEEELRTDGHEIVPARDELRRRAFRLLDGLPHILTQNEGVALVRAVVDRVAGLGPLEPLLQDPDVSEIMVNDPSHVFVERRGRIEASGVEFRDEQDLRHVIDRIVAPIGRRIDESSPMVDARLPDGSRVNAVVPPLALRGPTLTIRKFAREPFSLDRLVALGTISQGMADFLVDAIRRRA